MKVYSLFITFLLIGCASQKYPHHWWDTVPKKDLKWWEISPSSVKQRGHKVILSKRNELGLLSNFAATPFYLDGKKYASVEAFWQSLKFPENQKDQRFKNFSWPYTREEVEKLDGFTAKKAGSFGSIVMKKLKINWVTYKQRKLIYRENKKGAHYQLILRAMKAKLSQNPKVQDILRRTKGLVLLPDHQTRITDPPAWKYYQIWMELRDH